MKLRWLTTCDAYGCKSAPRLQYKDEDGRWQDVPHIEIKVGQNEQADYD